MFSVEERDQLRDRVIDMARQDPRVVAAAEVGSLAPGGEGDRWSDLDLTFAVEGSASVASVLDDWTRTLVEKHGAAHLFDLAVSATIYRVFMFRGCLQLDVSFTPASDFRPTSPRFRLVFGEAGPPHATKRPPARDFLGWAAMWARHARVSIERQRWWQAEHAISRLRESALDFAASRRGLPAGHGRGVEQLPPEVHRAFASTLVVAFDRDALRQALEECVSALTAECEDVDDAGPISERLSETTEGL
jgi:predicted nucleotidyltransferase